MRHGLDSPQVDLLASGASLLRPRGGRPSDEVARDRPSSCAILNPTKDFIEKSRHGPAVIGFTLLQSPCQELAGLIK